MFSPAIQSMGSRPFFGAKRGPDSDVPDYDTVVETFNRFVQRPPIGWPGHQLRDMGVQRNPKTQTYYVLFQTMDREGMEQVAAVLKRYPNCLGDVPVTVRVYQGQELQPL